VKQEADVVIIGAGAAGSFYAERLAKAGKTVIVLEAGPAWGLEHMVSSQIWSRRLKWGAAPAVSATPSGSSSQFGWGLGGAALHHFGTWPRPTADTFKLKSLYGEDVDWPFDYDQLRPYYDRIQDEMGISGDAAQEPWRPPGAAYPMPPLLEFRQGQVLKRGFDKLGLPVGPLPAAINSMERKDRPACIYDGWCDAGCPTGALANPLVTHLNAAKAAGAEFRTRATVTRIVTDERGRARDVHYLDEKRQPHSLRASLVVLAGSVIQNPRLLLNSANDKHPDGLANSSGLVGRSLMIESGAQVIGLFDEDTEPHMGVSAGQLMRREDHKGNGKRPHGGYQWQIAPAMKPNDLFGIAFTKYDLFGARLDAFIRQGVRGMASMMAFGADEPVPENRILLSSVKDDLGVPVAEIRHKPSARAHGLWEHMAAEGLAVQRAAGAREAWNSPLAPGHYAGGTIMGVDPAHSVTDSYGRSHDVSNLILTGAGLFPSNGGVSPTFTIYAVALRSVEKILADWKDYATA